MRNLLVVLFAAAAALEVFPDAGFAGKWALDPSRSEGLPPGIEQSLVIEQNGDVVDVTTSIVTDNIDRFIKDVYRIDGGEQDFDPQTPGLTVKKARRSARRTGARSFESTDHIEGENAGGPVTTDVVRQWELAEDVNTLTVRMAITTAGFTTYTKRVLVRGALPSSAKAEPPARTFPVDLSVSLPPTAFRAAGKTNIVYELNLTNFRAGTIEWARLEIVGDDGKQLASYSGPELDRLLTRPGVIGAKDARKIGAGMRAVAFLWLALDGPAPARVHHRAAFVLPASASGRERVVEGKGVPVRPAPIVIGAPFRGSSWVARFGGSNTAFHRRGLVPVDGQATIAQRFAIDYNRFGGSGHEFIGEGKKNEDFSVYGQEVIAVADGVIARVVSHLPENVPGAQNPAVGNTIDTAAGNHVSLRLPDGTYATYAHLQGPSIVVKEGERVRRGDVLGRVGNSGNSTGPHLHFQVASDVGLQGEGLPYAIESFEVIGMEEGPPNEGKMNGRTLTPEEHRNEMPAEHMVIRVPA